MTDPRGFLEIQRRLGPYRPVDERLRDYGEQHAHAPEGLVREQAQRCMDCGVPFCHQGCPLANLIPEWNDLVHRGDWLTASERLHRTNNFPEFTGKLCPAPCEESCVLAINDDAVTIKEIELAIAERALSEGWVVPQPPGASTGRSIGVVGSGPAGLACAQQLARAGHSVTVYERDDRPGGLLRYGIPDFKLDKRSVDLRIEQLEAEGVTFACGVECGVDLAADELRTRHDAVVLATGAQRQRDLEPARTRARRHPSRDAVPHRAEPAGRRPSGRSDGARGRRQEGRDPRRRRHLRRLPRERPARGRHLGDRDRPRPHAAARANAAADVARVAGPPALVPRARRGRRAPVADRDGRVRGPRRADRVVAGAARRVPGVRRDALAAERSRRGHRARRRPRPPRDRLRRHRAAGRPRRRARRRRHGARHGRDRPRASRPVSMACSRVATACAAPT